MINQEREYKKFQDETPLIISPPIYSPPPSCEMDKKILKNSIRTKRLAIVELVLSCLILLLGMISTGLSANIYSPIDTNTSMCNIGTSIWVPIMGIITAGLCLGALQYGIYSKKCLLMSHFVMCIISAVASGTLIIFTSMCLDMLSMLLRVSRLVSMIGGKPYGWSSKGEFPEALIAIEVFILLGALAHMIASIVSAAVICKYWCGGKGNNGTTIIYIQNPATNENGPMQTAIVPTGAQVVFLQSNAAVDQGNAILPVP